LPLPCERFLSMPPQLASHALASKAGLEAFAARHLHEDSARVAQANARAAKVDAQLSLRRKDRGRGLVPLSESEAAALEHDERKQRRAARLAQVQEQERALAQHRQRAFAGTRRAAARDTAQALQGDWEAEQVLRELEHRRAKAVAPLEAAAPPPPPEPRSKREDLATLERRLQEALDAVRLIQEPPPAAAAAARRPGLDGRHKSRGNAAAARPSRPSELAPDRQRLAVGEDDVLVLQDEGFSVESRQAGQRLADTRWFELKEEEMSGGGSGAEEDGDGLLDSFAEVRALLEDAKRKLAGGREAGRGGEEAVGRALGNGQPRNQPAAAVAVQPDPWLLQRLVTGTRAHIPAEEQVQRSKRLASRLPEVVERQRDVQTRQEAEARRRHVRELEDQRRARLWANARQ
jgi:hypothetical protein